MSATQQQEHPPEGWLPQRAVQAPPFEPQHLDLYRGGGQWSPSAEAAVLATPLRRGVAYLLDTVLLSSVVVPYVAWAWMSGAGTLPQIAAAMTAVTAGWLILFISVLRFGSTFGHHMAGIEAVDLHSGGPLPIGRAGFRCLVKLILTVCGWASLVPLLLDWHLVVDGVRSRSLSDRCARTVVVRSSTRPEQG
jgi:hypothetical protein